MDTKCLNSEDLGLIQSWYDKLEIAILCYQIQPSDLYNFDEIGFLDGQVQTESVIT